MKIIDNIKEGLVIIVDWTRKDGVDYRGFDGRTVWPNAEWQAEDSDTIRSLNKIIPKSMDKISFNPITVTNGLASINMLEEVLKYKSNLQGLNRLLYLKFADFESPEIEIIKKRFSFLGYDYGNYISEGNFYSLIYHEIIGGRREEFKNYRKYLNKNLLFSSLIHIPPLEEIKIKLKAMGEQLEDELEGEEFQPIAVYSYNESN